MIALRDLNERLRGFVANDEDRCIRSDYAMKPELVGITYFDDPLVACASANDPLFARFKATPDILGDSLRLPSEWLDEAKSVISIFFPFSQRIRASNQKDSRWPSDEWLHSRVEGQAFLEKAMRQVRRWLEEAGARGVIPSLSPDFRVNRDSGAHPFVSNWSERHAAYVAGLGTFGLSKHLITPRGVCGRFGSVITDAEFTPTPRNYKEPFEYCSFCGACVRRCPVNAISIEKGKDNRACNAFLNEIKERCAPRYGCGKCQVGVPCENRKLNVKIPPTTPLSGCLSGIEANL